MLIRRTIRGVEVEVELLIPQLPRLRRSHEPSGFGFALWGRDGMVPLFSFFVGRE